jgi:predicted SAM-dependent methyltransferase
MKNIPLKINSVPPNCSFEVDDMELDWTFNHERFDFIHGRDMIGLQDPEKLLRQCYHFLKPGGWVEISSAHLYPCTNDNSDDNFEDDSYPSPALYELSRTFHDISVKIGADPNFQLKLKSWFDKQGFANVNEVVLEIPCLPRVNVRGRSRVMDQICDYLAVGKPCLGRLKRNLTDLLLEFRTSSAKAQPLAIYHCM